MMYYSELGMVPEHLVTMVSNPCDPNPCKRGHYCSINHLCLPGNLACSHYICQPGCAIGGSPSLVYTGGSHVLVPVDMLSSTEEDSKLCP